MYLLSGPGENVLGCSSFTENIIPKFNRNNMSYVVAFTFRKDFNLSVVQFIISLCRKDFFFLATDKFVYTGKEQTYSMV